MSDYYQLIDCGDKQKLEKFGRFKLIRPCPQALWSKRSPEKWAKPDGEFVRANKETGQWKIFNPDMPESWRVKPLDSNLSWKIELNDFGNVGVFTEHWLYAFKLKNYFSREGKILNLFSYTGSNCLDLVKHGYSMTVVDSSKNAMTTYSDNLEFNGLGRKNQRLILEDAYKFISREVRRGNKYSGIIMDAPSFGRGTKGEVFSIEDDLVKLIRTCQSLMDSKAKVVMTLHSPRFTIGILDNLIKDIFRNKDIKVEEILNPCESGVSLPSGFLVWVG